MSRDQAAMAAIAEISQLSNIDTKHIGKIITYNLTSIALLICGNVIADSYPVRIVCNKLRNIVEFEYRLIEDKFIDPESLFDYDYCKELSQRILRATSEHNDKLMYQASNSNNVFTVTTLYPTELLMKAHLLRLPLLVRFILFVAQRLSKGAKAVHTGKVAECIRNVFDGAPIDENRRQSRALLTPGTAIPAAEMQPFSTALLEIRQAWGWMP